MDDATFLEAATLNLLSDATKAATAAMLAIRYDRGDCEDRARAHKICQRYGADLGAVRTLLGHDVGAPSTREQFAAMAIRSTLLRAAS
ncbi:MAG: hypothetical protein AAFX08_09255 [Pseudomonadota bacterium]